MGSVDSQQLTVDSFIAADFFRVAGPTALAPAVLRSATVARLRGLLRSVRGGARSHLNEAAGMLSCGLVWDQAPGLPGLDRRRGVDYICSMTQTCKIVKKSERGERCCSLEDVLGVEFFRALGDPRRQAILMRLATEGGAWTVSQVAAELPIDVSVVSRHLAMLRDAGVLAADRVGKEVRYTVRYDAMVGVLRRLADAIEGCCPPEDVTDCCAVDKGETP